MSDITVLLADDHPRLIGSVAKLLESRFAVIGAVGDGSALAAAALEHKPDVIVTDLMMGPVGGLEAAAAILKSCEPRPVIVLLTAIEDEEIAQEAFALGILGYVLKLRLAEDLIPAIEAALAGLRFLSPHPHPAV